MLLALLVPAAMLCGAAQAGPTAFCGKAGAQHWNGISEALVGHWAIRHHAGYARAGAMVIPFPADPEQEVLTIARFGEVLEASHPGMQAPMQLRLADEPRWTMDTDEPGVPRPSLTLSDLELAVGCDQMQLPRIVGTTTAMVDGTRMEFVNRLVFVDSATLYGVMEMTTVAHGTPVTAYRTVSLIRQGAD